MNFFVYHYGVDQASDLWFTFGDAPEEEMTEGIELEWIRANKRMSFYNKEMFFAIIKYFPASGIQPSAGDRYFFLDIENESNTCTSQYFKEADFASKTICQNSS